MKTRTSFQLVAMVCLASMASCADQPKTIKVPVATTCQPNTPQSGLVLQAVNAYRRSKGAAELQRHAGLDRLAQQHCEYLRQRRGTFELNGKNVSHIGFEGRALYARERFHMENIAENIAAANHAGANPVPALIALWKASKDHQKTMVDAWTHSGVGMVTDSDGTVFAVQLFATVNPSLMATRNRFNRF